MTRDDPRQLRRIKDGVYRTRGGRYSAKRSRRRYGQPTRWIVTDHTNASTLIHDGQPSAVTVVRKGTP